MTNDMMHFQGLLEKREDVGLQVGQPVSALELSD